MIASTHNPLVKHLVKLRENRKYREEQNSVAIFGFKLIGEIAAISPPQKIFVENLSDAPHCPTIYQVSPAVLKKMAGMPSCDPIAAEFFLPPPSTLANNAPLLVLDAVQDPGNVGTLLRTALAFGWRGVFFLPGCADPFHEKVIRSSRGALFWLPWREGSWEELQQIKTKNHLRAYIADIRGKPLPSLQPHKNTLLLLSNEGEGVSCKTEGFGEKITIPMTKESESLNVAIAGGVLMYYLREHG
jgi:RNA methyltransferase, TrmH family